jgi:uncharacterized iron-regulated membrane protein
MSSLWPRVNRWLVWFHRWAGVALCLLVAAWFVSGAILHFVPYPALARGDQLAHSETIELPRVRIEPGAALSRMPQVSDLRLVSVAGRPTYVGRTPLDTSIRVAADTGEVLGPLSAATAQAVAERFAGTKAARVAGPLAYDQWIVHQRFDRYRPLYRVRMSDADRTDLYVSAATGEVVQRTRFAERAWNWPGAVLHWIYFTPLRENWSAWNQTVWWVSLLTLLSSSAGIFLGVVRLISNRMAGRPGLSPFRGWMRWHHVIGLFASVIVFGWIFSGWLSMDHGRLFSRGQPTPEQAARVRGLPLSAAIAAASLDSLQAAGSAKEISVHALAGHPFLAVREALPSGSHVIWLGGGEPPAHSLPDQLLLVAVRAAWASATPAESAAGSDDMYRLAESLPRSARAFLAPTDRAARIYIDPLSGEILTVMDPGRRTYAWIYYALHTLNFPGLISRPFARTSVELLLLSGGLAFGVTGIVLAVRRLRHDLAR